MTWVRSFLFGSLRPQCAGWRLGINPFDQPDVQLAKQATSEVLLVFKQQQHLPAVKEVAKDDLLTLFVDQDLASKQWKLF
jgi:hypothetical protein